METERHRRSMRLRGFDYSQRGLYFVTICTHKQKCIFGSVQSGRMHLNEAGEIVRRTWHGLPLRFPSVVLDAFVVMPNHVHGIIVFVGERKMTQGLPLQSGPMRQATLAGTGAGQGLPLHSEPRHPTRLVGAGLAPPHRVVSDIPRMPALGEVVGAFKSLSAIEINLGMERPGGPLWQRNYYEHIIRTGEELDEIRCYVVDNPLRWAKDSENPFGETSVRRKAVAASLPWLLS